MVVGGTVDVVGGLVVVGGAVDVVEWNCSSGWNSRCRWLIVVVGGTVDVVGAIVVVG